MRKLLMLLIFLTSGCATELNVYESLEDCIAAQQQPGRKFTYLEWKYHSSCVGITREDKEFRNYKSGGQIK